MRTIDAHLSQELGPSVSGAVKSLEFDLVQHFQSRIASYLSPEIWRARIPAITAELNRHPVPPHVDYLVGRILRENGWHEQAIPFLYSATDAVPSDALYQEELVRGLAAAGQFGEAEQRAVAFVLSEPRRLEASILLIDMLGHTLIWTHNPNAMDVVALIIQAYDRFPEINLRMNRRQLSERIAASADRDGDLPRPEILALALAVDDQNLGCAMRLAQTLEALGFYDEVLAVVARYDWREREQVMGLRQLFQNLSKKDLPTIAAALFRQLVNRVAYRQGVTATDLGMELNRIIYKNGASLKDADPLFTAYSMFENWTLIKRARLANKPAINGRQNTQKHYRETVKTSRAVIEAHRSSLACSKLAPGRERNSLRYRHLNLSGFLALQKEFTLLGLAFRSQGGVIDAETGCLSGRSRKGEVFSFGPYIDILPGVYQIDVFGSVDRPCEIGIEVGRYTDNPPTVLAKGIACLSDTPLKPMHFIRLVIKTEQKVEFCEVVIKIFTDEVNFSLDHVHFLRILGPVDK